MGETKRLAANLAYTFLARAAELLSGLLIIGMLTRYLGLDEFGRYSVLMAVCWVTLPILNMGFPRILVREIAQRRNMAPAYILSGWAWNILMSLLLFIALFSVHLGYQFEQLTALLFISLTGGIMAMTQTAGSLSIALQYMHYETIPALTSMTILTLLVAISTYFRQGLNVILAAYTMSGLIGLLLTVSLTNKLFPYLRQLRRALPPLNEAKELFCESFQIGVFQILVQLHLYVSVFLLKAMADNTAAALFQAPFRIFTRVQIIPMTCMPVLLPIFSKLFFAKEHDELRRTSETIFNLMLALCLLLTFLAVSLSDLFIPLLLGSDFRDSIQLFKILSFSICFTFLNTVFNALFIASKKSVHTVRIQAGGVFFCTLINIIFIPEYTYIASSWAIVLSEGMMFMMNCFFFRKLLPNISLKTLLVILSSSGIGYFVSSQTPGAGLVFPLFLGSLVSLLSIFALRLISGKDVKMIYAIVRQPSTRTE